MLNRCKETVLRSDVRNEGKIFLSQLSPFNWNFVDPLSAHIFLTACISESNLFWLLANLLWIVWGWTQIPSCESLSISYEKNPKKCQYMCIQLNLFKRQLKGNQKKTVSYNRWSFNTGSLYMKSITEASENNVLV